MSRLKLLNSSIVWHILDGDRERWHIWIESPTIHFTSLNPDASPNREGRRRQIEDRATRSHRLREFDGCAAFLFFSRGPSAQGQIRQIMQGDRFGVPTRVNFGNQMARLLRFPSVFHQACAFFFLLHISTN